VLSVNYVLMANGQRCPEPIHVTLSAWAHSELAITFTPGAWNLGALHESSKSAFAERFALLPSGQSQNPVAILFLVPKDVGSATEAILHETAADHGNT
jgi:hypothetical protein